MTASVPAPAASRPLDLEGLRRDIDAVLHAFLQARAAQAAACGLPASPARLLAQFLSAGGKRLRPIVCALGWQAATGTAPPGPVVQAAACLEMFHAFCLIHDDVIGQSTTRRGRPAVHRALARQHAAQHPRPLGNRLGASCALLIGDLALTWSGELLHTAGLTREQRAAVLTVVGLMRTEVMYGRYLDVTATGAPAPDPERAVAIIRYKTAECTVGHPLPMGAVLGGAPPSLLRGLSAYAVPLGEAFQLRDGLLGVFGDPRVTGKSCLEDLREGKHTLLAALALRSTSAAHAAVLHRLLANPHLTEAEAARVRTVFTATRARTRVEEMISRRRERVLHLLASSHSIHPAAHSNLRQLAGTATRRTS